MEHAATVPPSTFAAFDDLQDPHTALEGEVAILSRLLDHGAEFDPAIVFAVERHLKAETAILGAGDREGAENL